VCFARLGFDSVGVGSQWEEDSKGGGWLCGGEEGGRGVMVASGEVD
jgi:hypothetical protein